LFWTTVVIIFFLSIFNKLPQKFENIFWIIVFLLVVFKAIKYVESSFAIIKKDLSDIREKLDMNPNPLDPDNRTDEDARYIRECIKAGDNFIAIRKHYIGYRGIREWATDGRDLAKYLLNEEFKKEKQNF
jgi:hypothetical protein